MTVSPNEAITKAFNPLAESVDVNIQDQISDPVEALFVQELGTAAIASPVSVDDKVVNVEAGHSIVAGNILNIREGGNFTQLEVVSVSVNAITVDSPLDKNYSVNASVIVGNKNMNVDGSVTPVVFCIKAPPDKKYDITRFTFAGTDDTAMDDSKFCGISALTNGLAFRKCNGAIKNLLNIKTNGDWALAAYDREYPEKVPAGVYAISVRKTYAGQEKSGVALRMDGSKDENLSFVIQDDLTGITSIYAKAHGHEVIDK